MERKIYYQSNPCFSAPEVLLLQPQGDRHGNRVLYGHQRDVWGAGIILAELLLNMDVKTHLFSGYRDRRLEERRQFCGRLQRDSYDGLQCYGHLPNSEFYVCGADLVKLMSLWNWVDRPRARVALEHRFFS